MEQFFEKYNKQPDNQADLVELIQRMWINKVLIIIVTSVFVVLGLLVALFSPKEYTSACDVVPQASDSSALSRMGSLAALAGINLDQMQNVKTLSPLVYKNIMESTTFRKELMQTPLNFKEIDHPISFYEYCTNEEYNKPSIGEYIIKYTVGLPFVILKAIRGEQPSPDYGALNQSGDSSIETVTKEEYECLKALDNCITLRLDDKKG